MQDGGSATVPIVHKQSCRACAVGHESVFQTRKPRAREPHPLLVPHSVTSSQPFIYTPDSYILVACCSHWSVTSDVFQ